MRPIRLKMEAFGCYVKPITLDFENNLRGTKIFLIHGNTGAGKTTILDAICFALYGTASGDERKAAMMRSKGIADNVKTEVEFTFALGDKIYTSRHTLTNRGDKISHTAHLKCDGKTIETKLIDAEKAVTELLGFDVKQFRQVVLLPQGEFDKFLSAKSDDRQPILNALFNASFYSLVEDGLKLKADAAQKIFNDLQRDKAALETQLQGSKSDEFTLAKLRADYAAAQVKAANLRKVSDEAQNNFTTGKNLADAFTELARLTQAMLTAGDDFKQAEAELTAAQAEHDLREGEQSQRDSLKVELEKLIATKKTLAELENKRAAATTAQKIFQTAEEAVKTCEGKATTYEARLIELKTQREGLSGAEASLATATAIRDKVREREDTLRAIAQLEHQAAALQSECTVAEENFNDAKIQLERLQRLLIDGSAARLAAQLKDGEPCPVCGSRTHYHVDFDDAIVPTDKELDDAQDTVDKRKKILDGKKNSAASIAGQLFAKKDTLKNFADLPPVDVAEKNFNVAKTAVRNLNDCNERIAKGEDFIAKNKADLETARKNRDAAFSEREKALSAVQAAEAQIPAQYSDATALDADIRAKQQTLYGLEEAWKTADKNFRAAANKKALCEGKLTSAQDVHRTAAEKLKGKTPPALDELKTLAETSRENYEAAIREEASLKGTLGNLEKLTAQILELDKKIAAAEKTSALWNKLSTVASGKIPGRKISFVRYYLRAMFEQVLTEANYRLEKMSDRRYWFRQKDAGKSVSSTAGLNLEIFDEYTGEARPVETLSGGEKFLASLSLALGLAAVVRNNAGGIKLDTIFIDEGFGSLDAETLDAAISTIIGLSGGRLVGIISHVEELKNQMPVRLEVTKTQTGSSAKFIS